MKKSNPVLSFLKEWALFIIFISVIILSRLFLWSPVKVDGHSMDPTLANGEYLLILKHQSIDRFDIVVATETDDNGTSKEIVKRVIGMRATLFSMKMILSISTAKKQTSLT